MNEDDKEQGILGGTQERKIEIVRVGGKISETGILKTTVYEEKFNDEGAMERISNVTMGVADCGHVGIEAGGKCPVCGKWYCKECAARYGTCFVCGGVACPNCSESTVLDKNKRYHKACFKEAVKRKLLG